MNRSCGKLLKLPHKINYCCTHLPSLKPLACEQALRDALAAGQEKEGELATRSLEFEFHLQFPCGSPLTELSDFHQSEQSGNERECTQTLKNMCDG